MHDEIIFYWFGVGVDSFLEAIQVLGGLGNRLRGEVKVSVLLWELAKKVSCNH